MPSDQKQARYRCKLNKKKRTSKRSAAYELGKAMRKQAGLVGDAWSGTWPGVISGWGGAGVGALGGGGLGALIASASGGTPHDVGRGAGVGAGLGAGAGSLLGSLGGNAWAFRRGKRRGANEEQQRMIDMKQLLEQLAARGVTPAAK